MFSTKRPDVMSGFLFLKFIVMEFPIRESQGTQVKLYVSKEPYRILQEQINSAVNVCEARIIWGLDVEEAFKNLHEEITEIFNRNILYED